MGPTKSDFANFILISFLIIIAITLITIRVKNIIIEISRKEEKEKYKEQRKRELLLQSMIFPKRFGNLIWKKRNGIESFSEKNLTENHEYITVFGNERAFIYKNIITEKQEKEYKHKDERGVYKWMGLLGPSQQTKEKRPNLNYGIIIDNDCNIIGFEYSQNGEKKQELFSDKYTDIEIIYPKRNYTWLISKDVLKKYYQQGLIKVFKEKMDRIARRVSPYRMGMEASQSNRLVENISFC